MDRNFSLENLREKLAGKRLSVLGDSISTYVGFSDNTDYHKSLWYYSIFYIPERLESVELTWWKRVMNECGLELCVDNAWSGSRVTEDTDIGKCEHTEGVDVSAWKYRCEALDNNEGEKPDVVTVYMGVNDVINSIPCTGACLDGAFWEKIEAEGFVPATFEEAYALTVLKIKRKYGADVFCFTVPAAIDCDKELTARCNTAIKAVAEHFGCGVVDLQATEFSKNYMDYTIEGLHPTAKGMEIIAEAVLSAFAEKYI